jgi:hypothetical protein
MKTAAFLVTLLSLCLSVQASSLPSLPHFALSHASPDRINHLLLTRAGGKAGNYFIFADFSILLLYYFIHCVNNYIGKKPKKGKKGNKQKEESKDETDSKDAVAEQVEQSPAPSCEVVKNLNNFNNLKKIFNCYLFSFLEEGGSCYDDFTKETNS